MYATGLGKKILRARKAAGKSEVEEVLWDAPDQASIQRKGGGDFCVREPAAWLL